MRDYCLDFEVDTGAVADLGEGPGGPGPTPLILGEKEEMCEGRKAGWASKIKPRPLLSSKSGSATGAIHLHYVHALIYSNIVRSRDARDHGKEKEAYHFERDPGQREKNVWERGSDKIDSVRHAELNV